MDNDIDKIRLLNSELEGHLRNVLKYAYLDIQYLLRMNGDLIDGDTLLSNLENGISNGDLDCVAETLVEIQNILGPGEI